MARAWYTLRHPRDAPYEKRFLGDTLVVPEELLEAMRTYLTRSAILFEEEPITERIWFDGGGMVRTDQAEMEFTIEGLVIGTYASHVAMMWEAAKGARPATELIGTEYFAFAGFHRKLLMTGEIRLEFVAALAPKVAESDAIASAEDAQWAETINKMNKDGLRMFRVPRGRKIKGKV